MSKEKTDLEKKIEGMYCHSCGKNHPGECDKRPISKDGFSTPPQSDWEKEFDERFPEFLGIGSSFPIFRENPNRNHIKSFISTLLQKSIEDYAKEVIPLKNEKWRERIEKEREETSKAFGGCKNCYGRGYHTTLEYAKTCEDFEGEKTGIYQLPLIRFCNCDRGKELKGYFSKEREELAGKIEGLKIKPIKVLGGKIKVKLNADDLMWNHALSQVLSLIKPNTPPNAGD